MSEFVRKVIRKTRERTIADSIKIKIYSKFYFNIDHDYRNTIFLASTGRSGSTWVSNIINYQNKYRYMFEPFHSKYVEICKDFNYRQYLRPDNKEDKYLIPAQQIISGRIRNKWIDRFNKKLISRRRLVKDIRANLLLKWLKTLYKDMKIILLIRHPLAVVNSRMKLGWGSNIKFFLEQANLIEDYLEPYMKEIKKTQSVFEDQIYSWCIENYVPLQQFESKELHVTFYEDFILKPEETIKSLFNFLSINYKDRILNKLHIPSPEVREESAILTGDNLVENWKKYFDKEQILKSTEILSLFNLDNLYSENSIPSSKNVFNQIK
jgi:hypothetical protein